MTEENVHVIVLAAGASTRFGSPKQLVRLNGRPLLHLAVSRAVEIAGQAVTVVLGANAAELAPLLRHTPATIVINRDWAEGMGSSVRSGIAGVPAAADAAMLMLADQLAAYSPRICAASSARGAGNPSAWSRPITQARRGCRPSFQRRLHRARRAAAGGCGRLRTAEARRRPAYPGATAKRGH